MKAQVFCKKCGLRGFSKCPYSRSVFIRNMASEQIQLEDLIHMRLVPCEGNPYREVWFPAYAETDDAAMKEVLVNLTYLLMKPMINLDVAACTHEWVLMPGEHCELGCHTGEPIEVLPDPFEPHPEENHVN